MTDRSPTDIIWGQVHWHRPLDPARCLEVVRRAAADGRSPRLIFEARATGSGISYAFGAPRAVFSEYRSIFQMLIPGTQISALEASKIDVVVGRQLKASTRHRQLRTDDVGAVTRSMLAALARVRKDEVLVLQLLLGPRRIPLAVPTKSPSSLVAPWWKTVMYGDGPAIDGEKRSALRQKVSDHGFACAVRIGVSAGTPGRRQRLVMGLVAAIRSTESAGLLLRPRAVKANDIVTARSPRWFWPLRLNVAEVAALTAWPIGDGDLPGHAGIHPRALPALPPVTRSKRIVAASTVPGSSKFLTLSRQNAGHHTHVLGPTGSGKSVLLGRLIQQDIEAGRGVILVEPKGDLVDDVLARIPEHRLDDVVVLDPSDKAPVGLNPLHVGGRSPDVVADGILTVFKAIYADAWGPRIHDVMSASLLTLARHGNTSLAMLPLLLSNPSFRRSITQSVNDPIALAPFWSWFENLSEAERNVVVAPIMTRIRPWLLNRNLRAVLGQTEPRFHLSQLFSKNAIVLVPLRTSGIGPEAAKLFGSLVVAQLWQVVQARAAVPQDRRRQAMAYIDELQEYTHLPTDLGDALAQARGLGLSLTAAHQHLAQLRPDMRAALLTNARSKICFQLSHDDASVMARGHNEISPDDFVALHQYEVYASLFANGQVNPYASGRTLAPSLPISSVKDLRRRSRERYGRPLREIEDSLTQLLVPAPGTPAAAPTGRKRRDA